MENFEILIVEQDADLRATLLEIFSVEGFRAVAVDSSHTALELIESWTPELVLIDTDGHPERRWERVRTIKSGLGTRDVPIAVMCTVSGQSSLTEAFEAGAVALIQKPFELASLLLETLRYCNQKAEVEAA